MNHLTSRADNQIILNAQKGQKARNYKKHKKRKKRKKRKKHKTPNKQLPSS